MELISIFTQIIIFFLFTSFPFNDYTIKNFRFSKLDNFAFVKFLNILFLFFCLLIFSFFSFSQKLIFYFFSSLYFVMFIFYLKNNIKLISIKKNFKLKLFFFLFIFFIFCVIADYPEIGWDGLAIWKFKANIFYLDENFYNLKNTEASNAQYPHLGSYVWSFFWKNSLLEKEYFGRFFYIYTYITAIFSLVLFLRDLSDNKKILIIFFLIISTYDKTLHGYQEYIIFSFLLFFGVSLLYFEERNKNSLVLSNIYLLTCSLLPWIKLEGSFYSLFIIILFISNKNYRNNYSLFCTSLIIVSIFLEYFIKKYVFEYANAFQGPINLYIFSEISLQIFIYKIVTITEYYIRGIIQYPIGIFNIIGLIFALTQYKKSITIKFILLFFLFNIFFLYLVYLQTPDIEFFLRTSMERLVLQTSGIYSIILVILINKKFIKI